MTTAHRDHAVVLGAGMAGLLAARALAEGYDRVTIVDRDRLPDHAAQRRGVPQGPHAHALLARGLQAMEELLPGLTADLIALGAPSGDALGNARLHFGGHLLRQAHTGLTVISVSRPFLEHHVRQRVRALPGVSFAPPSDVVGLAATPDARRIVGARILRRADGSAEETIDADLVVDATGRGSRTPVWMAALGYERPPEDRVSDRSRLHHLPVPTRTGRPQRRPSERARIDPIAAARRRTCQAGRRRVAADAVRAEG